MITPQKPDEDFFRGYLGVPQMGQAVEGAWQEDEGFRRPITLRSQAEQEKEIIEVEKEE